MASLLFNLIRNVLRRVDIQFGKKLKIFSVFMSRLNIMDEANVTRLLLEGAIQTRPTYSELYALCELSDKSNILHDYLRAFFLQEKADSKRTEMAQRLDNVISLRLSQNINGVHAMKLHQTIADYLLRARGR